MKFDFKSGAAAKEEFDRLVAAGETPEVKEHKIAVEADDVVNFSLMEKRAEKFAADILATVPDEVELSEGHRGFIKTMIAIGFTAGSTYMKNTMEAAAAKRVAGVMAGLFAKAVLGGDAKPDEDGPKTKH